MTTAYVGLFAASPVETGGSVVFKHLSVSRCPEGKPCFGHTYQEEGQVHEEL
jgi:hypothetical protein